MINYINGKIDILSMTHDELATDLTDNSFPSYRTGQIEKFLVNGVTFEEMHNIPSVLREYLAKKMILLYPEVLKRFDSKQDETVKYLFRLYDGELVESVLMSYEHGNTLCISCQAGCRMGCRFCASTINGKVRDLLPSEMLGQIIIAQKNSGRKISNIVMMGIGEPFDNYQNVLSFLKTVNSPTSLDIGYRHISVSTCGIVDKLLEFANENLPVTLSVSLHAADQETRKELMPIANKWDIDSLLSACAKYFDITGRRISFEYSLINECNDDTKTAVMLASLLKRYMKGRPFHVNLIPINEIKERKYKRSQQTRVKEFKKTLETMSVNATVRRRLGADINASCGQLRNKKY